MTDPRLSIIEKRFSGIRRIFISTSGKGGVGKSSFAAAASLILSRQGRRTGLLDLDFEGASSHIFLGAESRFPEEEGGLIPQTVGTDLKFMSISFFTGEESVALRGEDVTDAMLEIAAVTLWGELDALFIDMPPGMGDELLNLIRFLPRLEAVIITTPSVVARTVVHRLSRFLQRLRVSICGVVVNDIHGSGHDREPEHPPSGVNDQFGLPVLGSIPYDPDFERAIGNPSRLTEGVFASQVRNVLQNLGV
jgi:ATP-binding protein involved in chromosome partitioning